MAVRKRKSKGGGRSRQYAALPIRLSGDGALEVLLLTSRGTGRWIIPKGWPMRRRAPCDAAAREAYEEAGVEGAVASEPVGRYRYAKQRDDGRLTRVEVEVFLLRVARQLASWPEQAERETLWCDPERAAALVAEPELAAILRGLRSLGGLGSSGVAP